MRGNLFSQLPSRELEWRKAFGIALSRNTAMVMGSQPCLQSETLRAQKCDWNPIGHSSISGPGADHPSQVRLLPLLAGVCPFRDGAWEGRNPGRCEASRHTLMSWVDFSFQPCWSQEDEQTYRSGTVGQAPLCLPCHGGGFLVGCITLPLP